MALLNCNCRRSCTVAALISAVVIGVLAAFLQITGVITVAPAFLWVAFGIAVVYLAVLVVTAAVTRKPAQPGCLCSALNTLLLGILGTVLFAVVLLAVGVIATSIISAILVGLLLFFFTLTVTASACLVRCLLDCGS